VKRVTQTLVMGLLLCGASCAAETAAPSTAIMPPGALSTNGDIDVRSLDVAAYAFGRPLRNDPAKAADAIAALDYMGGELNTSPRWTTTMPSLFRVQMLQSREIIRSYVGVSSDAPSQAVVNTMLALAEAYRAGDQPSVERLLASPIFTLPPDRVAAQLANIPVIPSVNSATTHADQYSTGFSVPGNG
jgi:hypothetical protein